MNKLASHLTQALFVGALLFATASVSQASISYSDITTYTGSGFVNDGATVAAPITRLVADDINAPAGGGLSVTQFTFSVQNFDPTATFSARPRVRFYDNDGAGGGPGTLLTGFSFNPISFAPGISLFFTNLTAGQLVLPADGSFWVGMTFDNVGGTATVAQLNELGEGLFDPPTVGSSGDRDFVTTAAGSFLASNPAGTIRTSPFGAAPNANYGWEFQFAPVPEPSTGALVMVAGGLGILIYWQRTRRC